MQAVVYRGIDDLRVETLPVPRIGPGEILVRVAACGVCPTDIKKIHYGTLPPPRVFGHETSGTIAKVGARVRGFKVGERVALHHHVPCMTCHHCRHRAFAQCPQYKKTGITAGFEPAGGGYAQYVRVMSFVLPGVVKIPAKNDFIEGAMLEPVNTVLKGIKRLNLRRGDHALVIGQGPIGLLFTKLLQLHGIRVIATDLMPERLALAKKWGALHCLPGSAAASSPLETQIRRLTAKNGLDAAIIAVPVDEAIHQALRLVRGGGQVLLFAHTRKTPPMQVVPRPPLPDSDDRAAKSLPTDFATICADEKDLIGSYSSDFTLQDEVARWVFSRKLDVRKLVTHRFPLDQTAAAVSLAAHPTPTSLKIFTLTGL